MATTTRVLDANVNGAVYTSNANGALEAIDTCHSGATAPTDELANGKLWLDTSTTPGVLKVYNNAAWEVAGSRFGDNAKAIFGAGSDLQIYHDGNNSVIDEVGTGSLFIRGTTINIQHIDSDPDESMINAIANGAVTLSHNGSSKIATTAAGIDVTGTITSDVLNVGIANVSNEIRFAGAAGLDALVQKNATALRDELQIYSSGDAFGAGSLGSGLHLYGNSDSEHAGQLTIMTGSDDNGDARLIVSGSDTTKVTIGNGIFDYVDTGLDHALLNLKGPSGQPALLIEGASSTEGDIVVPDGEAMHFGHWNKGTSTFTERLQIDSSGNVGVGTSSPSSRLHVEDTGDTTLTVKALSSGSGNDDDANLVIDASGGGEAKINFSIDGTEKASIEWFDSGPDLNIKTASGTNGNIDFQPNGSLTMRVDSSGNVLVGKLAQDQDVVGCELRDSGVAQFTASATAPLILNRTTQGGAVVNFNRGGNNVGNISVNSNATSYNTSSDYRLKEDWVPMSGASERVQALKPVNFAWKVDASRVDGFLAHELQEVIPEAATGIKDAMQDEEYEVTPAVLDSDGNEISPAVMGTRSVPDMQGIDQSKIVPLLTAALQEALTKIADLEARVAALEP